MYIVKIVHSYIDIYKRIKELEAENARLKYEISFYDDFMREMREIAKPNRSVKKKPKQLPSKD